MDAGADIEEVAHNNADVVFTSCVRMYNACLKVGGAAPQDPHPELLAERAAPAGAHLLPRTCEVTYLLGMLAGIMTKTGHIGYVAQTPYGVPGCNQRLYAQGLKSVTPPGGDASGRAGPASPIPPIR